MMFKPFEEKLMSKTGLFFLLLNLNLRNNISYDYSIIEIFAFYSFLYRSRYDVHNGCDIFNGSLGRRSKTGIKKYYRLRS